MKTSFEPAQDLLSAVLERIKKSRENPPPKRYSFQLLALRIIREIPDAKRKASSIFKACKLNERKAKFVFSECKELNKLHVDYFLKVYHSLNNN